MFSLKEVAKGQGDSKIAIFPSAIHGPVQSQYPDDTNYTDNAHLGAD